MAKITKSDVLHLASLSRVSLDEEEAQNLQQELEAILGYIDQFAALDTADVEPTYQVGGLKNVWREDIVGKSLVTTESLLALAPSIQDNQIKVPKVL